VNSTQGKHIQLKLVKYKHILPSVGSNRALTNSYDRARRSRARVFAAATGTAGNLRSGSPQAGRVRYHSERVQVEMKYDHRARTQHSVSLREIEISVEIPLATLCDFVVATLNPCDKSVFNKR